jgi:hypothetical protein
MSVGGTEQLQQDIGFQERALIGASIVTSFEQSRDGFDARTTVTLVFETGRNRERLAAILLGKAEQSVVAPPQTVESFNHQNPSNSEGCHRRVRCWNSECLEDFQAEIFILHAVSEIDPAWKSSNRRF